LVCITKYRRRVRDARALDWLANHALSVFDKMHYRLLACTGQADNLHMLVEYPPKHSIPVVVSAFKAMSNRLLRKERPDIASRYRDGVLWLPA
jgi:putative transposase